MGTISTFRGPSAASLSDSQENNSQLKVLLRTLLPLAFKKEIIEFAKRNVLRDCGVVPPCCLKAHMVKTAREMGYEGIIPLLHAMLPGDGHNGYYLDGDELIKAED